MPPLERWAKQAVLLERQGDFTPVASASAVADLDTLSALHRQTWKRRNAELHDTPTALESFYGGLLAYPLASAGTAVNPAVATETALWTTATYTPIPANSLMVPEVFRISATGIFTTTATASPTLILTPRIGTTTGGATLGASRAIPLTASVTTGYWYLLGDMTCRSIGDGATGGNAYGMYHFMANAAAGPNTAAVTELFGHTVAAFDSKVAQGLFMSMTSNPAGATTSMTLQQIHWMSWN